MPDTQFLVSQIFVQTNGADISVERITRLFYALVEEDLNQPAMFELHFYDYQFDLIDSDVFKPGTEVTIGFDNQKGVRTNLLTGEVISLEPSISSAATTLVVRGYDKLHRLYRGRKTRAFLKKTDSQIASQIIQDSGMTANVTSTSENYPYVMQRNQRDIDFLRDRAARNGFRVWFDKGKVCFKAPESGAADAPEQKFGEQILSFNCRLTLFAQPKKVIVRGWDMMAKKEIEANAASPTASHQIGAAIGGAAAQTAFGTPPDVVVTDYPVGTQGEATALAKSVLDTLAGDTIYSEVVCLGEPKLRPGLMVKLSNLGTKFSGKYFISATRHVYTADEGYLTTIVVSGFQPENLVAIGQNAPPTDRVQGMVIGVVTNLKDPDNLGRVKVKFPWLDNELESNWARLVMPGAGKQRGWFLPPEINDEVLVGFEHGDINRPFVMGGLWNGKDATPAAAVADGKVKLRTLKTRAGHILEFTEDDGGNKGLITIKTAGGHHVILSDNDKKIEIKSSSHTVLLDDQGRIVKITSGGEVEITGSGSKLKFTASGLELSNGGGKLAIQPAGVNLEAAAKMDIKANAMLGIQGLGGVKAETPAILQIQGSLVKIN